MPSPEILSIGSTLLARRRVLFERWILIYQGDVAVAIDIVTPQKEKNQGKLKDWKATGLYETCNF